MKQLILNKTLLLLLVCILVSCSDEDSFGSIDDVVIDTNTPLIELEFSTSPIDLQGLDVQFSENIPYDVYTDTQFDIFLPNSETPTSLVVMIHGGGFTGGDKTFAYSGNFTEDIVQLLSNNIAVATINYRLIVENETVGVLKSLNDSKRALQFMRYVHSELNIDKDKIGLFGSSAGASTALWLATNDDLRDVNSSDPVSRESSRVSGIALNATQSSLNIEDRWIQDVFGDFGVSVDDLLADFGTEQFFNLYGVSSMAEYESPEIDAYRDQVDMLSLLSSDDPDIWVTNMGGHNDAPETTGSWNHHPFHAREIKEFAEAVGVTVVAEYGNPILFSDASNEYFTDFFIRKLNQ
jgi:pimeloyl-ACP methyl ester carboxylesterase